jgi:tetratricopeptide (TPR) repeat protein
MRNKRIGFFRKGFTLFFCGMSFLIFGQGQTDKQIQSVFDQLVTAYGSAKTAPQLIIVNNKPKQIAPAKYYSSPKPNIKVDAYLLSVCSTFGKDSLNALAIVLSHELAHYYSDHTFCSDYAYAIKDKNQSLVPALKGASLNEKISKETEADQKGFFYAAAAGFSPFHLQANLIDKIYKEYHLPENLAGYPTKQQRKGIAQAAEEKAAELYGHFKTGLKSMEEKNYVDAITAFETANSFIPYRENYNNIGVARTRKALLLKVKTNEEYKFPERFLYPLEIENKSRLNQEVTRAIDNDNQEKMEQLLTSAQKDFQEAIRLDPKFTKGYINLACVYELQGKFNLALGTIQELPKELQKSKEAQRILAITYFHNEQENKANAIWEELKM